MPGQEPVHLFVYGTLMDPQRVAALTGKHFARVEATLVGFERHASRFGYPYILPKPGATVHGLLLLDVDPVSLQRLDAYEAEGDLYRRRSVEVLVAGAPVRAMTYVGHRVAAAARRSSRPPHARESSPAGRDATTPGNGVRASPQRER
jgi:gamma-glutamylcyclotransferase (GGCT)/AIG2-like uncharacterized protein YtfP